LLAGRTRLIYSTALTFTVLLALIPLLQKRNLARAIYHGKASIQRELYRADPSPGLILSDNTLIPVLAGQRAFLLDDFMFRAIRIAIPAAQTDLYNRLEHQAFTVVILKDHPGSLKRSNVFGAQFVDILARRYELVEHYSTWDHLWIYRPRPVRPAVSQSPSR
jgi:hypothetical protein